MQAHIGPKEVLEVLTAIGPVIVGAVAVGVASWQGRLQRRQVTLALFKERYAVFSAAQDLTAKAFDRPENWFSDQELKDFARATDPARFLFGRDVVDVLHKIRLGFETEVGNGDVRIHRISARDHMQKAVEWRFEIFNSFGEYLQVHKPTLKQRVLDWGNVTDEKRKALHGDVDA